MGPFKGLFRMLAVCIALSTLMIPASHAQDTAAQRKLVNKGTVGVISGGVTGTYVRIASDLSNALDDGYKHRVLPILGKGSVRNIEDLLLLKGIDVAIVQSDVLDFYRNAGTGRKIEDKVHYIAKLYNEEVHLLARSEFSQISDLNGRKVNFGAQGSGTFMTAGIIFDALNIDADVATFPEPIALEKLRQGEIDALIFVGGKPLNLLLQVTREDNLKLLTIPADQVKGAYIATTLGANDYPDLIDAGAEVPTVAVGAVMAAYNWKSGHARHTKVKQFVERFFTNFKSFQQPPYHPKWKEVDLRADVPAWRRFGPAKEWLAANN